MNIDKNNPDRAFRIYSLLIISILIITRLPFFLFYPVTGITFDSASYCAVAFDLMNFNLPLFEIRTPGYPLFLASIWLFSKSLYLVSFFQSLFTLFTALFFLKVVNKYYRTVLIYFAIALTVYITSSYFLLFETALLTEGLFVNLLLLNSAFLIIAFKKNTPADWAIFSASLAITIIIRPAGLFLFSLIVLLTVLFLFKKYKSSFFKAIILPFSVLLLSLCMYNFITLGSFTLTPFGEANLSGVTITFMEQSEEYPEIVNNAIEEVTKAIPKKDVPYVMSSFSLTKLYNVFLFNYDKVIELVAAIKKQDESLTYTEIQPMIRKIYLDAIKKHPLIYGKFVLVNFIQFFRNIGNNIDYFEEIQKSYERFYIEKKYINRLEKGGWQQVSSNESDYIEIKDFYVEEIDKNISGNYISVKDTSNAELKPTLIKSINENYEKIYDFLFRNKLWLILFIVTFTISIIRLFKSRFTETEALIFFMLGVMFISKALMVSLVECSLERYSYTVEFVFYFSLPFLILFIKNPLKNLNLKTE